MAEKDMQSIQKEGGSAVAANRQRRRFVFELLFMCQFYTAEEIPRQLDILAQDQDLMEILENHNLPEEEALALKEKAERVMARRLELDQQIDQVATGWKTSRMGRTELTLIRQALYDILYEEEIPYRVAINEAVELAKIYGGTDAPAFVNGVLGKLVRSLGFDEGDSAGIKTNEHS